MREVRVIQPVEERIDAFERPSKEWGHVLKSFYSPFHGETYYDHEDKLVDIKYSFKRTAESKIIEIQKSPPVEFQVGDKILAGEEYYLIQEIIKHLDGSLDLLVETKIVELPETTETKEKEAEILTKIEESKRDAEERTKERHFKKAEKIFLNNDNTEENNNIFKRITNWFKN